jgi:hypothetical protein
LVVRVILDKLVRGRVDVAFEGLDFKVDVPVVVVPEH